MARLLAGVAGGLLVLVAVITPREAEAEKAYASGAQLGVLLVAGGMIRPSGWGATPLLLGAILSLMLSAGSGFGADLYGLGMLAASLLLFVAFWLGVRLAPGDDSRVVPAKKE